MRGDDAHQLPVAGGRVLALRALQQPARDRRRARLRRAALQRLDVAEPERLEVGQVEPADRTGKRARARADAVVQPQHPVPGDLVGPVVEQPDTGEEVLDVRRLEELQPAVLHERHAARGQLHLEQVAVVGGPHQHRLVDQAAALVDRVEHVVDDQAGLGRRVVAADQPGPVDRRAAGSAAGDGARPRPAAPHWPGRAAAVGTGNSVPGQRLSLLVSSEASWVR